MTLVKQPNTGDRGETKKPLFACPKCGRWGFCGPGLRNHKCPALGMERLQLDDILACLEAGPVPRPHNFKPVKCIPSLRIARPRRPAKLSLQEIEYRKFREGITA